MKQSLHRRSLKPMAALATAFALLAASARAESVDGLQGFIEVNYVETLALIPVLTLLGLLAVIVGLDAYIRPEHKRTMRIIIAVVFSLVAQNFIENRLATGEARWLA